MFKENKNIHKLSKPDSYSSNNERKELPNTKIQLRSSSEREEIETFTSWDFIKKAFKNNIKDKFLIIIDLKEYTDDKIKKGFKFIKTISPNPYIRLNNAQRKKRYKDLIIGDGIIFIWKKEGKTIKEVPSFFKDKYYEKLNEKTKHHLKEFTEENQINSNLNKIISLLKINQNIQNFKKTDIGKEIFEFLKNLEKEADVKLKNITFKNNILTLTLDKKNLWPANWNLNDYDKKGKLKTKKLSHKTPEKKSNNAGIQDEKDIFLKDELEKLGLPPDATEKDIKEAYRQKELKELGLPPDATDEDIKEAYHIKIEEARQNELEKLGLPPDATDEDIKEAYRQEELKELGLPPDATDKDIDKAYRIERERARQEELKELGLPPDATDEDIHEAYRIEAEIARQDEKERLGLPQDASDEDINDAQMKELEEIRENKAIQLGLPSDASYKTLIQTVLELPPTSSDFEIINKIDGLELDKKLIRNPTAMLEELIRRYKKDE